MDARRTLEVIALVGIALAACGCGRELIDVEEENDSFDFGRREIIAAIDEAAADPKNPKAIAKLAKRIDELSSQFNEPVELEAERKLVFLTIGPLESMFTAPMDEQLETLGLTVWPIAIEVDPEKGESPREYAARVCSGTLALECKYSVPDYWPTILSAVVWRRLHDRAREAYIGCGPCKTEPTRSYEAVLERFRAHQTAIGASAAKLKKRAHPNQWPTAGDKAQPWDSAVPLLELLGDGSAEFRGDAVDGAWRRMIRERREGAEVLGVHLRPMVTVRTFESVLTDARAAGYRYVDLQVRKKNFPYVAYRYRFAVAGRGGERVEVKPVDSIQILVQALEPKAGKDSETIFSLK